MTDHETDVDDTVDADDPISDNTQLEHVPRQDVANIGSTLTELAALKAGGDIMKARGALMDMARRIMIAATFPADYLKFRDPDGRETLFLQTKGAERTVDILGLETYNVSDPERINTADPAVFHYVIRGDARSRLTGRKIENIEGGRSSTDDFCKGKTGLDLELTVRKAARKNFEGRCARILAGLEGIPAEFVDDVWKDTPKRTSQCPRGRGFGSRDERLGAAPANAPDVEAPKCPHCGSVGVYRPAKGTRAAFWGCPNYSKHSDKKFIVDAAKWVADHPAKLTPAQAAGFTGADTRAPKASPPPVDFGGTRDREPGEDDE